VRRYIPRKGDFVVLTFNPQSVHEQRGRRPTLIISNDLFNQHTGLAISCPITSTNRQIPFHVAIPNHPPLKGFVMVDQVKSIDFKSRKVKYIGKAPAELLNKVLGVLDACLY
jgi:mRNA interferase MazF